ncbi:MAG: hypothetical protein ACRD0O_10560 [Acidimicrobiia bacterium]
MIFTIAVLVTAYYMVRIWRREKEPLGLVLIVGAALAAILEPMLDILGMAFHPRNQPILFETYGYPMPLWVLPLYTFYMSAFTMLVWRALERGGGPRTLWKFFGGLCFFDLVMETIGLSFDVWVYYGYQPLRIFQFPLWWAPCNAGGPVLAGIILYALRHKLPGWRSAALVVLPPISFMVSYAIVAWPTWAVLNTRLPAVVTWWGGAATLILGAAMCWFYCHLFELARHARTVPAPGPEVALDEPAVSPADLAGVGPAAIR